MIVRVFADETVSLDLSEIVEGLTAISKAITWCKGRVDFSIRKSYIEYPATYEKISSRLIQETKDDFLVVIFTEKPYDNNYFWESDHRNVVIVSLYGWDHLTSLPMNNGAVYFLAALLVRRLRIGASHRTKNTGCVNDFWHDKTGVDAGMRSAFICARCLPSITTKDHRVPKQEVADVIKILDEVSAASRANEDVCLRWARKSVEEGFDVFLCHNSSDKPAIRKINRALQQKRVRTWLDEEQLPPGRAWQAILEGQIGEIATVAVFVGDSGIGPWQDAEIRAFLSEFVNRKCPVIPVILAECRTVPQLPIFLRQFTWVDFRKGTPPPMEQLLWGITGERPMRA